MPALVAALRPADGAAWAEAAQGIMTTDTLPKAASRQVSIGGRTVTVTGISKGAGMIRPEHGHHARLHGHRRRHRARRCCSRC